MMDIRSNKEVEETVIELWEYFHPDYDIEEYHVKERYSEIVEWFLERYIKKSDLPSEEELAEIIEENTCQVVSDKTDEISLNAKPSAKAIRELFGVSK